MAQGKWSVEHDGPSRPIIFTPDKRMLSISQWENGRWVSYEQEEADCQALVDAMNRLMELSKDANIK